MALATAADWARYKGLIDPDADDATAAAYWADHAEELPLIRAGLESASDDIRAYIRFSVYATDDNGEATNPGVIKAITRATCAQLDWYQDTGDTTGAAAIFNTIRIASVSLTKAAGMGSAAPSPAESTVAPKALQILTTAGLRNSIIGYI